MENKAAQKCVAKWQKRILANENKLAGKYGNFHRDLIPQNEIMREAIKDIQRLTK